MFGGGPVVDMMILDNIHKEEKNTKNSGTMTSAFYSFFGAVVLIGLGLLAVAFAMFVAYQLFSSVLGLVIIGVVTFIALLIFLAVKLNLSSETFTKILYLIIPVTFVGGIAIIIVLLNF
jgi:hypothetical protein